MAKVFLGIFFDVTSGRLVKTEDFVDKYDLYTTLVLEAPCWIEFESASEARQAVHRSQTHGAEKLGETIARAFGAVLKVGLTPEQMAAIHKAAPDLKFRETVTEK